MKSLLNRFLYAEEPVHWGYPELGAWQRGSAGKAGQQAGSPPAHALLSNQGGQNLALNYIHTMFSLALEGLMPLFLHGVDGTTPSILRHVPAKSQDTSTMLYRDWQSLAAHSWHSWDMRLETYNGMDKMQECKIKMNWILWVTHKILKHKLFAFVSGHGCIQIDQSKICRAMGLACKLAIWDGRMPW